MTEAMLEGLLEKGGPVLCVVFLWFLERRYTGKMLWRLVQQSTKALTELNASILELETLLPEHCRNGTSRSSRPR